MSIIEHSEIADPEQRIAPLVTLTTEDVVICREVYKRIVDDRFTVAEYRYMKALAARTVTDESLMRWHVFDRVPWISYRRPMEKRLAKSRSEDVCYWTYTKIPRGERVLRTVGDSANDTNRAVHSRLACLLYSLLEDYDVPLWYRMAKL